jgi:hypothetical protein
VVRTIPTASPSTIHYIYDADGHVLAEHDGATGALLREYVWLDDMPLAQVAGIAETVHYFAASQRHRSLSYNPKIMPISDHWIRREIAGRNWRSL